MAKKEPKNPFSSLNPWDLRPGGGKAMVPQTGPKREEVRIRGTERGGCGDPNCRTCYNPDGSLTAEGAAGVMVGGSYTSARISEDKKRRERERVLKIMQDEMKRIRIPEYYYEAEYKAPEPEGPPQSYRDAREDVKEFIVPVPDVGFDEVIGNEAALGQIQDAIEAPVKYAEIYEAYGMQMPKGALLWGPPGCGKTMFAKAAATAMKKLYGGDDSEFLSINATELQRPIVGLTEKIIRDLFTFAREYKSYHGHPLLIFIDEAEVILPDRSGRERRVASWEQSQVATFLAEMDGMRENGAFVLLATNRPQAIDSALLRDGRCDYKIKVDRPNRNAMEEIIRRSMNGILCAEDDVETLVFAAVEAFYDPHKVIAETHALEVDFQGQKVIDLGGKSFCMEHIVSGAMAASVRQRAIRIAFARDKKHGKAIGVTVQDVLDAVDALFQENRRMNHEYAVEEFREAWGKEVEAKKEADKRKGMN